MRFAFKVLGILLVVGIPSIADDSQKMADLEERVAELESERAAPEGESAGFLKNILLSGEGGINYFEGGSESQYPESEFKVGEAKLFLDVQLLEDVFFFTELNIFMREEPNDDLRAAEIYIDAEDLVDDVLNVRAGRMDVPFGEEYLSRDAIDNPLISHSLSDIWAVDEGVEAYGKVGIVDYVLAVQNGSDPKSHDYNSDKAVVGRVGCEPAKWLRMSVSAMRTGELDAEDDYFSAIWFGNGFFRATGAPETTETFEADLIEGDIALRHARGHLKAAWGFAEYSDDDTAADNSRDIDYGYVEGLVNITTKLYAAARWSLIDCGDGYPIVGNGDFDKYQFEVVTKDLERITVGLGYRWTKDLVLKADYSHDDGETAGGWTRDEEDLIAAELAFRFQP